MHMMKLISAAFVLCLPASAMAQRDYPARPSPATDPSTWVQSSDWPNDLYQQEVEASVRVELDVSAQGSVQDCRIVRTSGYDVMDNVVCARLQQRGNFNPALSAEGVKVAAKHQMTVMFRYDDYPAIPVPETGQAFLSFTVDEEGNVSDCVRDSSFASTDMAAPPCPEGLTFEPALDALGKPISVRLITTISVKRAKLTD